MRVDRLVAKYGLNVKVTHFPLHPDTPAQGLTLEELFAGREIDIEASKARMRDLMRAEELPYGERTMTYNSRLAQELAAWAEQQENGSAIHDALFRAYFVENTNLAVVDHLVAIAEQLGFDAEDARRVLVKRTMRADVDADWRRSQELGVTGVPTFVFEDRAMVGAQPYESLEHLVRGK